MLAALAEATRALRLGEMPIGAVVVLGDQIIARAHTAEVAERRLLVHAELLALDAADRLQPFPGQRADVRLYTTLEPCLMCLGAALSFRLGAIHYALEAPPDGALGIVAAWQAQQHADVPLPPGYPLAPTFIPTVTQHHAARATARALLEAYVTRRAPGGMRTFAETLLHATRQ